MKTLGVIIACGKEEEITSGTDVAFLTLGNMPMLGHTLRVFQEADVIDEVIIAVAKDKIDAALYVIKRFGSTKVRGVVVGGVNRLSTLQTVFAKLPQPVQMVVIHEASRPFVTEDMLEETIKAAKRYGCAIAAHKIPDAAKLAPKGMKVARSLERNAVWAAQTPQAFKFDVLEKILDAKARELKIIDDESAFVRKPADVHMVEAGDGNIKIRTKHDLSVATALLNAKLV